MSTHPVHFGQKNGDVAHLQYLLNGHNRWHKDWLKGKVDGDFGPLTMTAVREARYFLGYSDRGITGHTVGAELISYLRPIGNGGKRLSAKMAARRAARLAKHKAKPRRLKRFAVAKRQQGYIERANNSTKFGQWYGMDNVAWCAIFVSWCDAQTGGTFHYAYTPFITRDARSHANGLTATGSPRRGDGVTFDWGGGHATNPYDTDHVGIFDRWVNRSAGIFATVEGNTSPADQSNGGEVMARERSTSLVACFFGIRKVKGSNPIGGHR